jgi:hypothetical protein
MTAQCWLHTDDADVHDVDLLEGWYTDNGDIIPAAMRCARAKGPGQDWRRRPATDITVEQVRS